MTMVRIEQQLSRSMVRTEGGYVERLKPSEPVEVEVKTPCTIRDIKVAIQDRLGIDIAQQMITSASNAELPPMKDDFAWPGQGGQLRLTSFAGLRRSSIVDAEVLQQGYLDKASSGAFRQHQSRYFVAAGHYLKCYESSERCGPDDDVKGCLDLRDVLSVEADGKTLTIVCGGGGKALKLVARSSENAAVWKEAIEAGRAADTDSYGRKYSARPAPPAAAVAAGAAQLVTCEEAVQQIAGEPCHIEATERRGITVQQLIALASFLEQAMPGLWDTYPKSPDFKQPLVPTKVNLYQVNASVIMPSTSAYQCSYVELVATNASEQSPNWFISHAWLESVLDFIKCVRRHTSVRAPPEATADSLGSISYWVCAYGNNQHKVNEAIPTDPKESSFFKAIRLSIGVLLILDKKATPFTRIWCDFEEAMVMLDRRPDNSTLLFDIVTAHAEQLKNDQGKLYDEAREPAVLTGSQLTSKEQIAETEIAGEGYGMKTEREKFFPNALVMCTIDPKTGIDITTAAATEQIDKIRILNSIAGARDLEQEPPASHPAYDRVNHGLRGTFACAGLPNALSASKFENSGFIEDLVAALHSDTIRSSLVLNLGSARALLACTNFGRSSFLPPNLKTLHLDFSDRSFPCPEDADVPKEVALHLQVFTEGFDGPLGEVFVRTLHPYIIRGAEGLPKPVSFPIYGSPMKRPPSDASDRPMRAVVGRLHMSLGWEQQSPAEVTVGRLTVSIKHLLFDTNRIEAPQRKNPRITVATYNENFQQVPIRLLRTGCGIMCSPSAAAIEFPPPMRKDMFGMLHSRSGGSGWNATDQTWIWGEKTSHQVSIQDFCMQKHFFVKVPKVHRPMDTKVNDQALLPLCNGLPRGLESLSLTFWDIAVQGKCLSSLATHIPGLMSLDLSFDGCALLEESGLVALAERLPTFTAASESVADKIVQSVGGYFTGLLVGTVAENIVVAPAPGAPGLARLRLSLRGCQLVGDVFISALAEHLPSTLTDLDLNLESCSVGENGLAKLGACLPKGLRSLDVNLTHCSTASGGAIARLAEGLPASMVTFALTMQKAVVSDAELGKIAGCLPTGLQILKLDCFGCETLTDAGLVLLAGALPAGLVGLTLDFHQTAVRSTAWKNQHGMQQLVAPKTA